MTDKARELLELALEAFTVWNAIVKTEQTKVLAEEIRAYLAEPDVKLFIRLTEEEVDEIVALAQSTYEAACATENRLVRKNK